MQRGVNIIIVLASAVAVTLGMTAISLFATVIKLTVAFLISRA